jgi:soluble lytic murein transglycosylase-like protein
VLLPRRTHGGPAWLKCRNKGKAVIVRIGSLNSVAVPGIPVGSVAAWRQLASFLVLVASVAALALIVEGQYGQVLFNEALQRPLDALSQATGVQRKPQQEAALTPVEEGRYRALSEYVAKRYRVSQDVAFNLVSLAHRAGSELQVDPLLIIAVMAVESGFNPIAESVAGAKGLMQIIPKFHGDKLEEFGGEQAIFDPATNIQVGAQILREYIRQTGNVGIALQMYAGALGDSEDQYTNKVMGMKQRLQYVVSQPTARPAATAPIRTASARSTSAFPLQID